MNHNGWLRLEILTVVWHDLNHQRQTCVFMCACELSSCTSNLQLIEAIPLRCLWDVFFDSTNFPNCFHILVDCWQKRANGKGPSDILIRSSPDTSCRTAAEAIAHSFPSQTILLSSPLLSLHFSQCALLPFVLIPVQSWAVFRIRF